MERSDEIPVARENENEEVRRRRVHELLGRPLADSMGILAAALGDESWRVRREAIEVIVSSSPGIGQVTALVELLRDDDNAGLRNATAEAIMRIGASALPALIPYLDDIDHDVRKFVVDALASIGGHEVFDGLVRALDDEDVNVASAAAEGLGASGMKAAVTPLLRALEEHQHDFFRYNVLEALGKVGIPAPLPQIIRDLVSKEMLRRGVYECLGRIGGDEAAAGILLEGALSVMPSIRGAAIASLSLLLQHLDEPAKGRVIRQMRESADNGLLDNLFMAFAGDDRELAGHVVRIIALIADLRGVPVLLNSLSDERMLPIAIKALLQMGKQALDQAVVRYHLADEQERAAICFFIGQLGHNSETVNSLIEQSLDDISTDIRKNAVIAVGKLASVELLSRVTDLLDDESRSVRDAALQTLRLRSACDRGLILDKAMQMMASDLAERRKASSLLFAALDDAENLSRLIKDVEPDVREAAVRAVGRMKLPGTCSLLVMALVDEVDDVRIAAAESLGSCNNCAAVGPLRLALEDSDPWVQAAAIRSLVSIGGRNVIADVMSLWKSGDTVTQLACLDVLEQIGNQEEMSTLLEGMEQHDTEVLKGVIELMGSRAPDLLVPSIDRILSHRDWDVRMSALKACTLLPPEGMEGRLRSLLEKEQNDLVKQEIIQMLDKG